MVKVIRSSAIRGMGKHAFRNACVVSLVFGWTFGYTQDHPATNVVCVEAAVDNAVENAIEGSELAALGCLGVSGSMVLEALPHYLADLFFEGLIRRGHELINLSAVRDSTVTAVIEVVPVECRIVYQRIHPSRWWKKSRIRRSVEVDFSLRVTNPLRENRIWTGNAAGVRTDTIPTAALDQVEQGGILFGKPDRPPGNHFVRIAEPLTVLCVLGGLVYSFYAIRSR